MNRERVLNILEKTVAATALCCVLGLVVRKYNQSREMSEYGFAHLSPTRIRYANGFTAVGYLDETRTNFTKIELHPQYIIGDSALQLPPTLYYPTNQYFSEIARDILGKSLPLSKKGS